MASALPGTRSFVAGVTPATGWPVAFAAHPGSKAMKTQIDRRLKLGSRALVKAMAPLTAFADEINPLDEEAEDEDGDLELEDENEDELDFDEDEDEDLDEDEDEDLDEEDDEDLDGEDGEA